MLISSMPWALSVERLQEISDFVLSGDIKAGAASQSSIDSKSISGNTGVIGISGVLVKKVGFWEALMGGMSTEKIEKDIQSYFNDPTIKNIILKISSPGGSVFGPFELSDFIYANRGKKRIIAYADGQMCSAAYLIASAADEIIAYDTSQVGSIGVVAILTERSAQDKVNGITRTVITNGKYKAVGNQYKPLTKEGKEYLQSHVDYYGSLFVEAVARNRGVSTQQALSMADGKVFIGQQAKDIGLVDHIGDFQFAVDRSQGIQPKSALKLKSLRDYKGLISDYQKQYKCSKQKAIKAIQATAEGQKAFSQLMKN